MKIRKVAAKLSSAPVVIGALRVNVTGSELRVNVSSCVRTVNTLPWSSTCNTDERDRLSYCIEIIQNIIMRFISINV